MGGNLARILKAAGQKGRTPNPSRDQPRASDGEALEEEKSRFADGQSALRSALLAEADSSTDPRGFVRRMNELMLEMAARAPHHRSGR